MNNVTLDAPSSTFQTNSPLYQPQPAPGNETISYQDDINKLLGNHTKKNF
jgi:hypothetical protein